MFWGKAGRPAERAHQVANPASPGSLHTCLPGGARQCRHLVLLKPVIVGRQPTGGHVLISHHSSTGHVSKSRAPACGPLKTAFVTIPSTRREGRWMTPNNKSHVTRPLHGQMPRSLGPRTQAALYCYFRFTLAHLVRALLGRAGIAHWTSGGFRKGLFTKGGSLREPRVRWGR